MADTPLSPYERMQAAFDNQDIDTALDLLDIEYNEGWNDGRRYERAHGNVADEG